MDLQPGLIRIQQEQPTTALATNVSEYLCAFGSDEATRVEYLAERENSGSADTAHGYDYELVMRQTGGVEAEERGSMRRMLINLCSEQNRCSCDSQQHSIATHQKASTHVYHFRV